MFYVYHIAKSPTHLGYIGVTNNLKNRWRYHKSNDFPVGHAIRKYSLAFEDHMRVVFTGSEEDCYNVELILRPRPRMGYNLAIGGIGGFGKMRKGIPLSEDHITKLRAMWSDGRRKGEKNSRAKVWTLTRPDGSRATAFGNLQQFCDGLDLNRAVLMKNLGSPVPDINVNGYGGYRKYNEETHRKRLNTTGWILTEGIIQS